MHMCVMVGMNVGMDEGTPGLVFQLVMCENAVSSTIR